jgi:hypothetical protein
MFKLFNNAAIVVIALLSYMGLSCAGWPTETKQAATTRSEPSALSDPVDSPIDLATYHSVRIGRVIQGWTKVGDGYLQGGGTDGMFDVLVRISPVNEHGKSDNHAGTIVWVYPNVIPKKVKDVTSATYFAVSFDCASKRITQFLSKSLAYDNSVIVGDDEPRTLNFHDSNLTRRPSDFVCAGSQIDALSHYFDGKPERPKHWVAIGDDVDPLGRPVHLFMSKRSFPVVPTSGTAHFQVLQTWDEPVYMDGIAGSVASMKFYVTLDCRKQMFNVYQYDASVVDNPILQQGFPPKHWNAVDNKPWAQDVADAVCIGN